MEIRNCREAAFALIEFLIVIGILTLVSVLTIASLATFRRGSDLDGAAEGALDAMRVARSRTLGSENASSYGVYFETATHTIFAGRVFVPGAAANEAKTFPADVEMFSIQLSTSTASVVFDRITGNTSTTGTIGLRTLSDQTQTRTIRVEPSGNAYLTATTVPELGTRIMDTRHLHFDLGWSIQNASTLRLRFSDPPNPDIVNDVGMAPYFDVPKSDFTWEGDTDVYGQNQHLKVHTHFLDGVNTILSTHRDRRYNTRALTVSIIDGVEKQIVSYDVTGTSTVGIYGGTMTQQ